jgi:hypothetical protein
MVVFVEPGQTWVLHVIAGHARFADGSGLPPLGMGDTALMSAGEARLRHAFDGAGEALLIRLAPVDDVTDSGPALGLVE